MSRFLNLARVADRVRQAREVKIAETEPVAYQVTLSDGLERLARQLDEEATDQRTREV